MQADPGQSYEGPVNYDGASYTGTYQGDTVYSTLIYYVATSDYTGSYSGVATNSFLGLAYEGYTTKHTLVIM